MTTSDHERVDELLAQHVVDGLSSTERRELDSLLGARSDAELFAWEHAATLCDLAVQPTPRDAALSPALRARLEARGHALLRASHGADADAVEEGERELARVTPLRRNADLGWWVAAAALIMALLSWWPTGDIEGELSLVEQVALLERDAPDLQRANWSALEDPRLAAIQGEVLWSDSLQAGFMRLSGVPRNDPAREQYQLWIVDQDRDAEPVDGGVFDVLESGEVLIPIDAKLAVRTPEVFAITLEQPGGVVVSEGPLLAAASMQG
ncbi:MAG: hypothetical protein DHS20C15_29770 [Planctomycetota bacterium]|nr:MAG: hypothetical protein DHS20C15_29770 [Planctomycetota bacterium]